MLAYCFYQFCDLKTEMNPEVASVALPQASMLNWYLAWQRMSPVTRLGHALSKPSFSRVLGCVLRVSRDRIVHARVELS